MYDQGYLSLNIYMISSLHLQYPFITLLDHLSFSSSTLRYIIFITELSLGSASITFFLLLISLFILCIMFDEWSDLLILSGYWKYVNKNPTFFFSVNAHWIISKIDQVKFPPCIYTCLHLITPSSLSVIHSFPEIELFDYWNLKIKT